MRLFIAKSADPAETRTAILPTDAGRLTRLGAQVEVQAEVGAAHRHRGRRVRKGGRAKCPPTVPRRCHAAEMVLRMDIPGREDIKSACPRVHPCQLPGSIQQS